MKNAAFIINLNFLNSFNNNLKITKFCNFLLFSYKILNKIIILIIKNLLIII